MTNLNHGKYRSMIITEWMRRYKNCHDQNLDICDITMKSLVSHDLLHGVFDGKCQKSKSYNTF